MTRICDCASYKAKHILAVLGCRDAYICLRLSWKEGISWWWEGVVKHIYACPSHGAEHILVVRGCRDAYMCLRLSQKEG